MNRFDGVNSSKFYVRRWDMLRTLQHRYSREAGLRVQHSFKKNSACPDNLKRVTAEYQFLLGNPSFARQNPSTVQKKKRAENGGEKQKATPTFFSVVVNDGAC
jgi:hypothetical protein